LERSFVETAKILPNAVKGLPIVEFICDALTY
jgi:hypothetical protein